MKKVLFLTYFFPPMPGGGVERMRQFVRHLPNFGWQPIVVTTQADANDGAFNQNFNSSRIVRVRPSLLVNFLLTRRFWRGLLERLMVPDSKLLWLAYLRRAVDNILQQEKIDVVFTSCKPFSLNLEGERVKKYYSVPWVTDFRDPWTDNAEFEETLLLPVYRQRHLKLEARAMEHCDYYIANTPTNLERAKEFFPVLAGKSAYITNGYSPEDFDSLNNTDPAPTQKSRPRWLVYTGACYGTYIPKQLFYFLRGLREKHPEYNFEIHYAGLFGRTFQYYARRFGLGGQLYLHGYLNRRDSLELIRKADCLLLFLPDSPKAKGWVPSKLYEYIASGRPILGVLPNGDAQGLVSQYGASLVISPSVSLEEGVRACEDFWTRCFTKQSARKGVLDTSQFHWFQLTSKLAQIFDRVVEGNRAIP